MMLNDIQDLGFHETIVNITLSLQSDLDITRPSLSENLIVDT